MKVVKESSEIYLASLTLDSNFRPAKSSGLPMQSDEQGSTVKALKNGQPDESTRTLDRTPIETVQWVADVLTDPPSTAAASHASFQESLRLPPIQFDERIVHFDLKGAPPKLDYYDAVFPLLHKLGATGLLMEYEDMFPYTGMLSPLSASNAYKEADIAHIVSVARANHLQLVSDSIDGYSYSGARLCLFSTCVRRRLLLPHSPSSSLHRLTSSISGCSQGALVPLENPCYLVAASNFFVEHFLSCTSPGQITLPPPQMEINLVYLGCVVEYKTRWLRRN
ncbi:hypothetical protein HPB50_022299 [Hyalomma asiaticum]|uniref:Uncharacterized protein n=1 Tax=Hyalomma asiaticum TaxID=266040 RepID=A0ACB7TLP0_HYAAI|nr:hypothetical protein HPB50_022299 [Hyalomma asiaticum]